MVNDPTLVNVFFGIFVNFERRFSSDQGGWACRPTSKIANYGACASGKRPGSARGALRSALARPAALWALFTSPSAAAAAATLYGSPLRLQSVYLDHDSPLQAFEQLVCCPCLHLGGAVC